jgi:hypothetical protein
VVGWFIIFHNLVGNFYYWVNKYLSNSGNNPPIIINLDGRATP